MSKITFDGINKLIIVNDTITGLNVKNDLYSEWKTWILIDDNAKYLPAFNVIGGDPITETVSVDGTYFIINGWKIRPYEGNHVLTITGNLYVDGGGSPLVPTIGNYNVLVNMLTSNIVNLVTVATGSGVTTQDKTDIITGVKNELLPSIVSIPTDVSTGLSDRFDSIDDGISNLTVSLSQDDIDSITDSIYTQITPDLNIIKGLMQHNFRFKNQQYDGKGKLVSGTIKIYPTSTDCTNDANELAVYSVSALYNASGNLTDYKVITG